jgi:hypothetical protein
MILGWYWLILADIGKYWGDIGQYWVILGNIGQHWGDIEVILGNIG